jgi:hypothetical protein
MGMFATYHFTEHAGKLIYYEINTMSEHPVMRLFVNTNLVDQKEGSIGGTYTLSYENLEVSVEIKMLKTTATLRVNGLEVPFPSISKKELAGILSQKGIENSINPSHAALEGNRLKPQHFAITLALIALTAYAYTLIGNHPKIYFRILGFVLMAIGPYYFVQKLVKRFPNLNIGKLGLAIILVCTIGLVIGVDYLNYGDRKALFAKLGTDQSEKLRVRIEEVAYQDVVYYKGRPKNEPYYNHIYSFQVNGKNYSSGFHNPSQVLNPGDSLDIYYLKTDPRINDAVQRILVK